ncbi:MAG: zinc ABC transporter substrate-binding protein [Planctomycetota bacterium]
MIRVFLAISLLVISSLGCQHNDKELANGFQPMPESSDTPDSKRIVAASYALQFLTQEIVGDTYMVEFPMQSSDDPKSWTPSVKEILSIQKATALIVNGPNAKYANWIDLTTLPAKILCNSCDMIDAQDLLTISDYQITHQHGPEGEHSHPYQVPYTWLDPVLAEKQAKKICSFLVQKFPSEANLFETNFQNLKEKLRRISRQYDSQGDSSQRFIISSNPHAKYLTRRLGVTDLHLLVFDAISDDPAAEDKMNRWIESNSPKQFVYFDSTDPKLVEWAAQNGLTAIQLDLLDKAPDEGDFLTTLESNLKKLAD